MKMNFLTKIMTIYANIKRDVVISEAAVTTCKAHVWSHPGTTLAWSDT